MEADKRTSPVLLLSSVFLVTIVAGKATDIIGQDTGNGNGYIPELQHLLNGHMDVRFQQLHNLITAQSQLIDFFCKRMDAFEKKLDKLETSVVSNLNKIAEKVKNEENRQYDPRMKDLEGNQLTLGKIEGTTDSIVKRLEKLQQQIEKRDSNLEAEVSYVIATLETVKGKQKIMESKIGNSSSLLNMTKHMQKLLIHFHTDEKKHMNKLHDNIISSMLYLDNKTTEHFLISEENHELLRPLKKELKEDFNNYANKVADMTSALGTSTKTLQKSVEGIESKVHGLQTGIKVLIDRAGLGGTNGTIVCEDESIQEVLRNRFEKVLANQYEFMKGCYKVQMQEPQIEDKISTTLEKLLDMLVKRFATNDRDATVFKHLLKNHHEQTQRNLVQINDNVATAFGQSNSNIRNIEEVVADVQESVKALYTYLKEVLPDGKKEHFEDILDKLQKIEEYTKKVKGWPGIIKPELKNIQTTLSRLVEAVKPVAEPNNHNSDTIKAVQEIFGKTPKSLNTSTTGVHWDPALINIRGELDSNRDAVVVESGTSMMPPDEKKSTTNSKYATSPSSTDDATRKTIVTAAVTASQNSTIVPANDPSLRLLQNSTTTPASHASVGSEVETGKSSQKTSLQNVSTVPLPRTTVTSLQSSSKTLSHDGPGTTIVGNATSLQNDTKTPSNDEVKNTITEAVPSPQNPSKVPSNDDPGTTTIFPTDSSKAPGTTPSPIQKGSTGPSNDEPVKNDLHGITSQTGPKIPSNDEPGMTKTTTNSGSTNPSNHKPVKKDIIAITSQRGPEIPSNDEPGTTKTPTKTGSTNPSNDEPVKINVKAITSQTGPKMPSNNEPRTTKTPTKRGSINPSNDEQVKIDVKAITLQTSPKIPLKDEPGMIKTPTERGSINPSNDEPVTKDVKKISSQTVSLNDESRMAGTTVTPIQKGSTIPSKDKPSKEGVTKTLLQTSSKLPSNDEHGTTATPTQKAPIGSSTHKLGLPEKRDVLSQKVLTAPSNIQHRTIAMVSRPPSNDEPGTTLAVGITSQKPETVPYTNEPVTSVPNSLKVTSLEERDDSEYEISYRKLPEPENQF